MWDALILWYTGDYCPVLYCTKVYCDILWYAVVYCDVLWYTVVYCDVLWYILWYTVVYCDIVCNCCDLCYRKYSKDCSVLPEALHSSLLKTQDGTVAAIRRYSYVHQLLGRRHSHSPSLSQRQSVSDLPYQCSLLPTQGMWQLCRRRGATVSLPRLPPPETRGLITTWACVVCLSRALAHSRDIGYSVTSSRTQYM